MSLQTLVLILHVLGSGVVFGVVFFSVFLVVKPGWSQGRLSHLHFVGRFGMWASGWQVATGVYLAGIEWSEFSSNTLFWTKMALYLIEGTLAGLLIEKKIKGPRAGAKPSGLSVSILSQMILIVLIIGIGVLLVER